MQLIVTGKQIDTGAALRQNVAAILEKYFRTAIEARVVLSKKRRVWAGPRLPSTSAVASSSTAALRPRGPTQRLTQPPSGCIDTNADCATTMQARNAFEVSKLAKQDVLAALAEARGHQRW
jgi:hypothetical protein